CEQLFIASLFDDIVSLYVWILAWQILSKMLRHWRLVRNGLVAPGVVIDRDRVTKTLSYEYQVNGQMITAKQDVRLSEYKQTQVGDTVTVLYSEANPRTSLIYKWAQF